MFGLKYPLLILTYLLQQNCISKRKETKSDHSYMFNRSLEWIQKASFHEIEQIISTKGFVRLSISYDSNKILVFESKEALAQDSLLKDQIESANKYYFMILNCEQFLKPKIETFQRIDYLERAEIWEEGAVFIFKNCQLTHIWLEKNNKIIK